MRIHLLLIAIIGFFLYLPSLFGPFLWDDEDFVYANQYVKEFRLDKFFTDSQTAGRGKLSNYYRPIPQIAYAVTHTVFGFNPFWFHLLNILTHIGAAYTVFAFFKLFLEKDENKTNLIPLLISLVFLAHPVQTEAVSYISGLSDPLFVLFGFLSLIFYILKDERKNMIPLSLFFFGLSILSKETGLVFLPLLISLNLICHSGDEPKTRTPESLNMPLIKQFWTHSLHSLTRMAKNIWPYALTSVIHLWYHFTFINIFDIKSAWGNTPYANSIIVRLLTFIQNLHTYVGLLIFPKDLFMERDFSIQIQTQILNPYLFAFILLNTLLVFAIWKLKNSLKIPNSKLQILLFCFLGFFLSFLPYTGIVLINGIFYEHFLYLPLVFFFSFWIILFSSFWLTIFSRSHLSWLNKIASICAVLVLLAFVARNVSRQFDWNNSIRFYKQTLVRAPKSVRIINGLGMAYAEKGELDKAIKEYSRIPKINPNIPNAYHNLANAHAANGNLDGAEKNYLKALEVDPNFHFSAQSLINLYQQTGQKEKLEKLLTRYQK